MVRLSTQRKERCAGHIGNLRLWQRVITHEDLGVEDFRKCQPCEQTTLRIGERDLVGEVSPNGVEHQILLAEVDLTDRVDVTLDVVTVEVQRDGRHVEGAALGVGGELQQAELLDDVDRSDGPSEP